MTLDLSSTLFQRRTASKSCRYFGRFVTWLQSTFAKDGRVITNGGGAIGAIMSPMYAACTSQIVKPASDLVFVEFVQNDLYRQNGALLPW